MQLPIGPNEERAGCGKYISGLAGWVLKPARTSGEGLAVDGAAAQLETQTHCGNIENKNATRKSSGIFVFCARNRTHT